MPRRGEVTLNVNNRVVNLLQRLGIGAVVILQLLFTYATPLQAVFNNEAIPTRTWPLKDNHLVIAEFLN